MLTTYQFIQAYISAKCMSVGAASLVEYGLLVALIAVVCIMAVTSLGENASEKFGSVAEAVGN
jgi:Flp pilus assembly pilin Flp